MKTIKYKIAELLAVGLVTFMSSTTFAQEHVGNGGGSHYCAHRSFQELYDVYEGKNRYHFQVLNDETQPVQYFLDYALNRLMENSPELEKRVQLELQHTIKIVRPMPSKRISRISDATITMVDAGCEYRQMANWDDAAGFINVDEDILKSFTNLNLAAFYLHETIYKVLRDDAKISTSDEVRRTVGLLLSLDNIQIDKNSELKAQVKPDPYTERYSLNLSQKGEFSRVSAFVKISTDYFVSIKTRFEFLKGKKKTKEEKKEYWDIERILALDSSVCLITNKQKFVATISLDSENPFSVVSVDELDLGRNSLIVSCTRSKYSTPYTIEISYDLTASPRMSSWIDHQTYRGNVNTVVGNTGNTSSRQSSVTAFDIQ